MSNPRLPYSKLSPGAYQALIATKKALEQGALDVSLLELINLRVSQINGCSFCTTMHSSLLRKRGTDNGKIDAVAGWRASDAYTERERVALSWAESLTQVSVTAAPDEAYEPLKSHFSDAEISDLTFAVALMNALNRLGVGMRL